MPFDRTRPTGHLASSIRLITEGARTGAQVGHSVRRLSPLVARRNCAATTRRKSTRALLSGRADAAANCAVNSIVPRVCRSPRAAGRPPAICHRSTQMYFSSACPTHTGVHKTPLHQTWLEDPPPWLRFAYCFASVIVRATGGAYSAPQTPYLDFRGPTSKGSEGGEEAKTGKEGKGTKRGKGRKRRPLPAPPPSQFATPLGQASPSRRPGLWVT